jgi:hypothetical protein
VANATGHQSCTVKGSDTDRDINTFVDQVEITVGQHQVGTNARMRIQEIEQQWCDMHSAEQGWCRDTQHAMDRRLLALLQLTDGLLVVSEDLSGTRAEVASRLGRCELPR